MKFCFITDGSRSMGMGHVQQSSAFAAVLRDEGEISFLTKSDDVVATEINKAGFDVTRFNNDIEIFQALSNLNPDVTIFDKIDVSETLAKEIRFNLSTSLAIFTNLTDANRYADVAVKADIGSDFKNITYSDAETKTRYYFGPKYWILRPEFYRYKNNSKQVPTTIGRLLLIFGGSDPTNLTSAAIEVLLKLNHHFQIDVIIGAQFPHERTLDRLLTCFPNTSADIRIHKNIRNVAELMYAADLTIVSPGLSTFESLIVGTPVLVIPHNELQRDVYRGFMSMVEREQIESLGDVIERMEFTYPHENHVQKMEIGEGVEELRNIILDSVHWR